MSKYAYFFMLKGFAPQTSTALGKSILKYFFKLPIACEHNENILSR